MSEPAMHVGQSTSLADRAREDAEARRRAAEEYERTRQPTSIERLMAYRVGRILGIEIDWRTVRDLGWQRPYYIGEVDARGITFRGRFMHDTNGLHHISAPMTASRVVRGRFGIKKTEVRSVDRIADLEGWL